VVDPNVPDVPACLPCTSYATVEETMALCHKLLPRNRLNEAAALAADAFAASPSYVTIAPGAKEQRTKFLRWLFARNFMLRVDSTDACRATFEARDDGGDEQLVAFFMFAKPTVPDPSLWEVLRFMLPAVFSYDAGTLYRLYQSKVWFEQKEREVLGSRAGTAIRLERMAVHPSCQGRGVGSRALGAALLEADQMNAPCVLATQVRFRLFLPLATTRPNRALTHSSTPCHPSRPPLVGRAQRALLREARLCRGGRLHVPRRSWV
jgi:GNAT superfamily N-acetyltransferase